MISEPTPVKTDAPFLYLAPIRGLTDALFRNVFYNHFDGIDEAIAPFINPQQNALYKDKMLADVLPERNTIKPIVPQILNIYPDDFLILAKRLADLGYSHINWNLGCPAPMVARKKRGSGFLPYPDEIVSLLENVVPKLSGEISIKTRLGYHDKGEILTLLDRLNDFPLKEIIIHTRLGNQLYRGKTDPDSFSLCQERSKHALVYNGDINDLDTFKSLAARFPTVDRWMVGRGVLMNPFLAEEIKGYPMETPEKRKERLYDFHKDLFTQYQEMLAGPSHLLGRMKMLWMYLISSMPGNEKTFKKIKKSKSITSYTDNVTQLFSALLEKKCHKK